MPFIILYVRSIIVFSARYCKPCSVMRISEISTDDVPSINDFILTPSIYPASRSIVIYSFHRGYDIPSASKGMIAITKRVWEKIKEKAEIAELETLINEGVSLQKKYKNNFAIDLTVAQNKQYYAFLSKEREKSVKK